MKKSIKKLFLYSLSLGLSTLLATAWTDNEVNTNSNNTSVQKENTQTNTKNDDGAKKPDSPNMVDTTSHDESRLASKEAQEKNKQEHSPQVESNHTSTMDTHGDQMTGSAPAGTNPEPASNTHKPNGSSMVTNGEKGSAPESSVPNKNHQANEGTQIKSHPESESSDSSPDNKAGGSAPAITSPSTNQVRPEQDGSSQS